MSKAKDSFNKQTKNNFINIESFVNLYKKSPFGWLTKRA